MRPNRTPAVACEEVCVTEHVTPHAFFAFHPPIRVMPTCPAWQVDWRTALRERQRTYGHKARIHVLHTVEIDEKAGARALGRHRGVAKASGTALIEHPCVFEHVLLHHVSSTSSRPNTHSRTTGRRDSAARARRPRSFLVFYRCVGLRLRAVS